MKNERNKRMLAYLLCVVLAVTSLAGSGVAQGSTAYAQGEGDGKGDDPSSLDGSEQEKVATGAAFWIDFDEIKDPEPETDIPKVKELKDIILSDEPGKLTVVSTSTSSTVSIKKVKKENVTVQWLMDDNNDPVITEGKENFLYGGFRYGREYSVKVSYTIDPGEYRLPGASTLKGEPFHLDVNDVHYTLIWDDKEGIYKAADDGEQKNLENVKVELSKDGQLSITKTFPLETYTKVDVTLGENDSETQVILYKGENESKEYADEIIFDADDDGNQIKITLKPKKLRKFLNDETGKVIVTVTDQEKNKNTKTIDEIEIKDGKLVIDQCGNIVTMPQCGNVTTETAGKKVTFKAFHNNVCVGSQTGGDNNGNPLKCTYNYKVDFKWKNSSTTSSDMMNSHEIVPGINRWSYEVYGINGDNSKKRLYSQMGKIVGYDNVSEDKRKIDLIKGRNSQEIANDLFGKESGITISNMRLDKKDKEYITVNSDKISARKLTKNDITVRVTKIKSGKEIISLEKQPIEVKVKVTPPAGEIWFQTKNKGRRINCYFSPKINELAEKENMKRYGIKSIKVKIKYSKSKSNKQKYFKTAPAAVKRYFQPTVPKKERYVTSRKKFTVKRFQAEIFYMTASGKVQGVLKVTGKYGDKRK